MILIRNGTLANVTLRHAMLAGFLGMFAAVPAGAQGPLGGAALPLLRTPASAFAGPPRLSVPTTPAPVPMMPAPAVDRAVALLREALVREVPSLRTVSPARSAAWVTRARAALEKADQMPVDPQLAVVVDRNPAVEQMVLMVIAPDRPWQVLGADHVSTGQAGRRDYYFTPVGVFAHTDAILDFRAEGTVNENGVRGLGSQGMRVWDFGWQWAIKGWREDGEGGDIRLQMHATDPELLESRLGRPASEGCIRLSSAMDRFLDRHGVLDADYERAAVDDIRYRALLRPDRVPTLLAGRLLVVIDSRQPPGAAPTAASRPSDLPPPDG